MYEESSKKLSINWVSLAIKLGILIIIVFLLCWLFTRNKNKTNNTVIGMQNEEYIANITAMKEAALEYFTDSKLPENIGGTKLLSLNEMLNQKLLIDFTDNGKKCNTNTSYIQATKTADGAYALKVNLVCGEDNDFIISTIEAPKCPENNTIADNNTDKTEDVNPDYIPDENDKYYDDKTDTYLNNNQNNNNNSNSNTNNNSSNNSSSGSTSSTQKVVKKVKITISACGTCNNNQPKPEDKPQENKPENKPEEKTLYYKFKRYTDWTDGYSYDELAENKKFSVTTYDFCKVNTKRIYTTGYSNNTKPFSSTYTLQLLDLKANQIKEGSISVDKSSISAFTTLSDYSNYLEMKLNDPNVTMLGNNPYYDSLTKDLYLFRDTSLKNSNMSINVNNPYQNGNNYFVDITYRVNNITGVKFKHDSRLNIDIYSIPIKFDIKYSLNSECVTDTIDNAYKYSGYNRLNENTEYMYKHRLVEYTWSTKSNLDGWTYTGEKEYR